MVFCWTNYLGIKWNKTIYILYLDFTNFTTVHLVKQQALKNGLKLAVNYSSLFCFLSVNTHPWQKFKIALVRKPERKLFSFQFLNSIFQGSRISFRFLNFCQECYYFQKLVGVVVFAKVQGPEGSAYLCKNHYSH